MTRLRGSTGAEPDALPQPPPPPPPSSWRPPNPTTAMPAPSSGGTLADVVRSAAAPPGVVVLDVAHDITNTRKETLKLDEDLWLSTADGRFNSPIIPMHVGEEGFTSMQTFYVRFSVPQYRRTSMLTQGLQRNRSTRIFC